MNNLNKETLEGLEILAESDATDDIFAKMYSFLHKQINKKDVTFSQEIQDRFSFDISKLKFDHTYFEFGYYNPLVVYIFALVDIEVYNWLEKAYNLTHNEIFSQVIFEEELARLNIIMMVIYPHEDCIIDEKIYDFNKTDFYDYDDDAILIYGRRPFDTIAGRTYDIHYGSDKIMEDGKIQLSFMIEYDRFETYNLIIDDSPEYRSAAKFNGEKRYDEMFLLVENRLRGEISEWLDNLE